MHRCGGAEGRFGCVDFRHERQSDRTARLAPPGTVAGRAVVTLRASSARVLEAAAPHDGMNGEWIDATRHSLARRQGFRWGVAKW